MTQVALTAESPFRVLPGSTNSGYNGSVRNLFPIAQKAEPGSRSSLDHKRRMGPLSGDLNVRYSFLETSECA